MQEQFTDEEKQTLLEQKREGNRIAREEVERRRLAEKLSVHRLQLAADKRVAQAEKLQRDRDRAHRMPVALANLDTADRDASAARLLFQGLTDHYLECVMAARIDIWADAAHKIIDLLSDPLTKVSKRREVSYDQKTR